MLKKLAVFIVAPHEWRSALSSGSKGRDKALKTLVGKSQSKGGSLTPTLQSS
jgi:hypothetical protein